MKTRIKTDTATVVLFDPVRLKHRVADSPDWWSIPEEELLEINNGNILFVSTGTDGVYDIKITSQNPPDDAKPVKALLKNESGRFFLGIGEETSGGDCEPEAKYGNIFLDRKPGVYHATVWMEGDSKIFVQLVESPEFIPNEFAKSPSLV